MRVAVVSMEPVERSTLCDAHLSIRVSSPTETLSSPTRYNKRMVSKDVVTHASENKFVAAKR